MFGFDIESGDKKVFSTALGRVEAFGHMVELQVLNLKTNSMAYFFADERIARNLLGRAGWLDRFRFGLIDYDRAIYLSPYDFVSGHET
jgi:hypothetical protein